MADELMSIRVLFQTASGTKQEFSIDGPPDQCISCLSMWLGSAIPNGYPIKKQELVPKVEMISAIDKQADIAAIIPRGYANRNAFYEKMILDILQDGNTHSTVSLNKQLSVIGIVGTSVRRTLKRLEKENKVTAIGSRAWTIRYN